MLLFHQPIIDVFHRTLFFFFLLLGFLLKLEYDILIYLHKFPLKSQVAFICLSRPREGNEFPRAEAHLDANLMRMSVRFSSAGLLPLFQRCDLIH